MGYLAYGAIFLLASGVLLYAFGIFAAKENRLRGMEKKVKVTIPEALDYSSVFDDILRLLWRRRRRDCRLRVR